MNAFSIADRLIFSMSDVSNFCKSFIYLKVISQRDDFLRAELENGRRPWEYEDYENVNSQFYFKRDWFDIDTTNKIPKWNIPIEFNKFLTFHCQKTFQNSVVSIVP